MLENLDQAVGLLTVNTRDFGGTDKTCVRYAEHPCNLDRQPDGEIRQKIVSARKNRIKPGGV
jgi:hypothetical protein